MIDIKKIRKEEVLKQVKELAPSDKEEIKKQLGKINVNTEVKKLFKQLETSTGKTERIRLLLQYKNITNKISKEQEDEMLSIIGEKEAEEWHEVQEEDDDFDGEFGEEEKGLLKKELEEYKKRVREEEEREEEIERIKKIKIKKTVIKQGEKDAEKSRKLTVKDVWMRNFNRLVINNELAGEILLHVFLGQALRHIKIYAGGKVKRIKSDMIWIQNSGSGKGESIHEFFIPIIKEFEFEDEDEETGDILTRRLTYSTFRGQSTLAGMLNRYKRDSKGKYTDEVIEGPLQKSNFWIYPEANDLLSPSNYNEKLIDALLDLMEGKEHEAFLEKYNKSIKTNAHGSLIATTRHVDTIQRNCIRSGLLNRTFSNMRELTDEEMGDMQEKNALQSFGKEEDIIDKDIERKKLLKKLKDIVEWSLQYKNKDYPVTNPNILNKLMAEKIKELRIEIKKDVKVKEFKVTLFEYISRIRDKALALSYQNAIIRKSSVDVQDLVNAFIILKKCLNNIKYWIFENVHLKKEVTEMDTIVYYTILKALKKTKDGQVQVSDIKKIIEGNKRLNLSGGYIYKKIQQVVSNFDEFTKLNKRTIKLKEDEA